MTPLCLFEVGTISGRQPVSLHDTNEIKKFHSVTTELAFEWITGYITIHAYTVENLINIPLITHNPVYQLCGRIFR